MKKYKLRVSKRNMDTVCDFNDVGKSLIALIWKCGITEVAPSGQEPYYVLDFKLKRHKEAFMEYLCCL